MGALHLCYCRDRMFNRLSTGYMCYMGLLGLAACRYPRNVACCSCSDDFLLLTEEDGPNVGML